MRHILQKNKENIMKRIISFTLAALLTASAFTACDTTPVEETAWETDAVETADITETAAPESDADTAAPLNITENGHAMVEIVVPEGAASDTHHLLPFAGEELRYHIEKVSGASLPVLTEGDGEHLPILIATPETHPDLPDLFPEDIAWLTTLADENGRRWGDDGFAIRQTEDAIYIFGVTPRGALNGVYDFIEENMGVLWVRSDEDIGLIYDEMPTITAEKVNYREKSPFQYRGTSFGYGFSREALVGTEVLYARNKLNNVNGAGTIQKVNGVWEVTEDMLLGHDHLGHCLKFWVLNSPIYDPECTEYWNVDQFGEPLINGISQINFWSEKTLDTVTAAILELLGQHPELETVPLAIEDGLLEPAHCNNPPYSEQPYEYAPGEFVEPGDKAFHSTVVFSFVNKVARRVAEEYPHVTVMTYAYHNTEVTPLCDIEPNVGVVFCPITGCMADNMNDPDNPNNELVYGLAKKWSEYPEKGVNVGVYEYYFSYAALADYERPIWYKLKSDLTFFAECGFNLIVSEGSADVKEEGLHVWSNRPFSAMWDMNSLTAWIYAKLLWNPEEDVDALIDTFCEKVYGEAAEYMREYYDLLYKGWIEGESDMILWNYKITTDFYLDYFVYQPDVERDIIAALRNAYEAADDGAKERIRYIKETFEAHFPEE